MATKIKVAASNGSISEYTGTYKVTDSGVLSVKPDSGNPVVYSPAGWFALEVIDAPDGDGFRVIV